MNTYHYDLHIHSCLSPCGDNDMTPNNLVQMALLSGCDVIALTDHNTCRNAPAAMEAGARNGLLVIPGAVHRRGGPRGLPVRNPGGRPGVRPLYL